MKACWFTWTVVWLAIGVALVGCEKKPEPGTVLDEARQAGIGADKAVEYFKAADEDYFHDMDGGITLTPEEIKGRNTWIVWTGGNDRLWDKLTVASFGALDFLKVLSSHPGLKFSRDHRWSYLGLVNEPCFEKATGPDPQRQGLWLDKRKPEWRSRLFRRRHGVVRAHWRIPGGHAADPHVPAAAPLARLVHGRRISVVKKPAPARWHSRLFVHDSSLYRGAATVKFRPGFPSMRK